MSDDVRRPDAALVALDWGTTTFRAWLLDPEGHVLEQVRTSDGTLRCSEGTDDARERAAAFERTFLRLVGPWLRQHPAAPVLCAGMAGSNHGWAEAGYLDVPADLGDLAGRLTTVATTGRAVHLVPGLRVTGPDPDVMRGEEVQLVGALDAPEPVTTVVLPGTHSKWVRLDGRRVTGFSTAMTGELYGLLMRDSILARLSDGGPGAASPDGHGSGAFVRGLEVEAARGDERGLPALLFTARTLVMAGDLRPDEVADYVSGLLVGAEVRHALRSAGPPGEALGGVAVCGSGSTAPRYRLALERAGVPVRTVDEDAAARGLWRVALDAGLVARTAPPILEDQS